MLSGLKGVILLKVINKNFVTRFGAYWIVNIIILLLVNTLFPGSFELGNVLWSTFAAAVISGILLTVLIFIARQIARYFKLPKRGRYFMFGYYWIIASASIWIIARIAAISGFGIARFYWAIATGFVVAGVHWLVRQGLKKTKLI
jgi:uncharacterized membrane protein YvlD (DUF360 family)